MRALSTLLALASVAHAQRAPSWVELRLATPINPLAIQQLGKTCTYAEANRVHFFSGFSRQWKDTATATANPVVRVWNDLAFVVDPAQIIAFSSYRGTIEAIPVSAGATVVNPGGQRNDSILVVRDGATLWTFSAFRGSWSQRQLAGASPIVVTQRHVALLAEGTNLYGMSAFDGTWVAAQAQGSATAAFAEGSWGIVETPTAIHGFSAQRRTWSSTPILTSAAGSQRGEDCVVYWDGTRAIGYSGMRGAFATTLIAAPPAAVVEAVCAALQVGNRVHLYSSVLNQWSQVQTPLVPTVTVRPHVVVIDDSGALTAYSPFLGTVATLPAAAGAEAGNAGVSVALNVAATQLYLYSSLVGYWVQAPPGTPATLPATVWCGALVQTPAGWSAWSGRSGRFVPVTLNGPGTPATDANSGVVAVEDPTHLHVFEPRREFWLSVRKVSAAPLAVRIWRTTLLAVDGSTVHGYGAAQGTIESHVLPGPPTDVAANSESLRAVAGTTLAAFGATPDLVTLYQFPEFRRVFTIGSDLELQIHGESLAMAWGWLGLPAANPVTVPPLGELFLGPSLLIGFPLGVLPADGRVTTRLTVPDHASLRGAEIYFQGLVVRPAGTPYLTRLATLRLH